MPRGISPKQRRFIDGIVDGLSGKAAAIEAGYAPEHAEQYSARNFSSIKVLLEIARARGELARAMNVSRETLVGNLLEIALNPDTQTESKIRATEAAAKMLGYAPERMLVDVSLSRDEQLTRLAALVAESRARASIKLICRVSKPFVEGDRQERPSLIDWPHPDSPGRRGDEMERWTPPREPSRVEQILIKRAVRVRKLFAFLRLHRHELFDDGFQTELESMYRTTGAGVPAVPAAQLCMAMLLQGYLRISDAEAVEMTIADRRWQMVLDCLDAEEPAFSQGTLQGFRERLIAADMDRRLLERTVELARRTKEFDWKKLPKDLRLAVDSRPLVGAGRVEDTINLLGHAARKVVAGAAKMLEMSFEEVCQGADIPLLRHASVKAGLDINWSDPEQKDDAVNLLHEQITRLVGWIEEKQALLEEPLRPFLEAIARVQEQDLEKRDGKMHVRQGVAEDRRISIEDSDMRHGRKSKSKRFNGFKQHVGLDLDTDLIVACAVTPANRPEEEATPELKQDVERQQRQVGELHIDRAYVNSSLVAEVLKKGGEVLAKPWALRNSQKLFTKGDFKMNMRDWTITCPAGQVESFEPGDVVEFDPEACGACPLRDQCTHSASGGRTVHIAEDEQLQQRLRKLQGSSKGRERLRERVGIEHRLAHLSARQGPHARYRGTRKNLFDLRRHAVLLNLETIQGKQSSRPKLRVVHDS